MTRCVSNRPRFYRSRSLLLGCATISILLRDCAPTALLAQIHSVAAKRKADAQPIPTGQTVFIDTTLGRIACTLFSKQAPLTSANFVALAEGTKDWTDPGTNSLTHGKPFYDGLAIAGLSDGITSGDRLGGNKGLAGPPFPGEMSGLAFDRAGRLAMARAQPGTTPKSPTGTAGMAATGKTPDMSSASAFVISSHADVELARRATTIFGQCDAASIPIVAALSHTLLSTDNHPSQPFAINHITVLHPGDPTPPITPNVPTASVTPQPVPAPTSGLPSPEPAGPTALIDVTFDTRAASPAKGQLSCRLFQTETPLATANFIGLAAGTKDFRSPATHSIVHGKHFYDGLTFRRVIPDFMIQNADMPGDPGGGGDLGFHFANEIVPGLTFDRPGRLAYANAGPDTNASEFFITEHPNHRLDGNYTIFGQCDSASVTLVETIARVPRDEHNKPLTPVIIRHITMVRTSLPPKG